MQNSLTAGQAKTLLGIVLDEMKALEPGQHFTLDFGYGIVGALNEISGPDLLSFLEKFKKGVSQLPNNQVINFHLNLGVVNPAEKEVKARIDERYQLAIGRRKDRSRD